MNMHNSISFLPLKKDIFQTTHKYSYHFQHKKYPRVLLFFMNTYVNTIRVESTNLNETTYFLIDFSGLFPA